MNFATRLKELRKKKKVTQSDLADYLGIDNTTVSKWEKGIYEPNIENLKKLADFFGVSIDSLLGRIQSTRRGFGRDHSRATKKYIDLRLLEDLPESVHGELQPPVLFYHVLQLKDDIPITISKSFLPNSLPLEELEEILKEVKQNPTLSLYKTLESFGRKPISCEETLIVDSPSDEEIELLQMPDHVPVARIVRKTFDASSKLVEYCVLTSRTDLYQFVYKFTL
ncbi:helix-turn-helix domain-containing protein [Thermoactinomyces sp. CICC 10522]|uniref:helix-turn-helix domain-containing protein n=1 Tax=Thermoactinomyces sp. CICC 10522 TaxID=2767427 RepID=UPI0018DBB62C|nr:helix-turn-helix domain-containing protein [Thermoactinomyces sp. CICC 10522]MBH8605916.1 helix-turn-helix domain-containing protein [Thermoactinomyces sp. CICC 10522]